MHLQQRAMNHFADFLNTRNHKDVEQQGVYLLEQTISVQKPAYEKAKQAQLPDNSWYYKSIDQWLRQEFEQKIANYRLEIEN